MNCQNCYKEIFTRTHTKVTNVVTKKNKNALSIRVRVKKEVKYKKTLDKEMGLLGEKQPRDIDQYAHECNEVRGFAVHCLKTS